MLGAALRRLANTLVVVIAAVCVTVGGADAASAHFGGGREPSNWRGEILSVTPQMPGVSFTLTDSADRIEVRNTSSTPLIIYGYQHKEPGDRDPYLKVSADGVWVNTESQAGYLNETLYGAPEKVPDHLVDDLGDGEPVWEKVSDEGVYRWHDHRIHWMSPDPPSAVTADPSSEHLVIAEWAISAKYGDQPESTITGELRWIPQQAAPWWIVVVVLAIAVIVGGALRNWRMVISITGGVLAVLAVAQAVISPLPQDEYQGEFSFILVSAAVPALAVLGLCLLGVRALRRSGDESAPYLLGGAGALAAIQGSSDVTVLTRSQLEHGGPDWLARLIIAAVIGVGVGMVIAMLRRVMSDRATGNADDAITDDPPGSEPRVRPSGGGRGLDIASDEEMRQMQDEQRILGQRRRPREQDDDPA
ncbi:MAG: hypothetical protein ACK5MR_04325 [Cumulibacter sp.]